MALYDDPPHAATIKGPGVSSTDTGGGTSLSWPTTRQAAVPCSINTLSGAEIERFAQTGLSVTHRMAVLTSVLSSAVARGDQVIADDTSAVYVIQGIEKGRDYGSIPSFTYLSLLEQL